MSSAFDNLDVQTPPPTQTPPGFPPHGRFFTFYARYRKVIWGTLIVAALAVAGLLVYVLFFNHSNKVTPYQGHVQLTIDAPQQLRAGSEISYKIAIQNQTNTTLTNFSLEIFYPDNFTFLNSSPEKQDNQARAYTFSDLPAGQEQDLILVGSLEGNVQDIKTLSVKAHYTPQAFRSEFTAQASASTSILAPDIALQISAPAQVIAGENITYQLTVSNISAQSFSGVSVVLTYPDKFQFSGQASPAPAASDSQSATWNLSQLGPNQSTTLTLYGKILAGAGINSFVTAELKYQDSSGQTVSAGKSFAFTQILPPPLAVTQKILDPIDNIVQGSVLNFEVDYENISDVALNNVVIAVVFDSPVFDFSKLTNTKAQLQGSSLVWIPAALPELLTVNPHASGTFNFAVPVAADLVAKLDKNPQVMTHVQFFSKEIAVPILGNTLSYPIQTEAQVMAKVRPIGGAIPPVPGQATTYQVTLSVANGVSDLVGAVLTATVPQASATLDQNSITPPEEQSQVTLTPLANLLQWNLGRVFAFSGSFHAARQLTFNLTVTTNQNTQDQYPVLLQNVSVSGTDEFTSQKITSNNLDSVVYNPNGQ